MASRVEIATTAAATSFEDITGVVNWQGARFGGTAHRGEIDTGSGFNLLDNAGVRTLPMRRRVRVIEDAVGSDYVIWQGRTVGDNRARGVIRTDDSKAFDVSLVDINAEFGGIGFAGVQRPAESDVARIQYLLTTYLDAGQNRDSTVISDTYLNTGAPYALVKHLYEGIQLIDWFTHITDTTGREFFLTNLSELFYDTVGSTAYASGFSIDDRFPDSSTRLYPGNPEAFEDGTEMFTRVRFRYLNGLAVAVHSAAETANDQWGTGIVDESVTTQALAEAQAERFLDEFDHSHITFSCFVDVPADQVDLISWGMTISVRSAAMGILSPTTLRISRLSWELLVPEGDGNPGRWRANLELDFPTKFGRSSIGGGSGNPGTGGGRTIPATAPVPFVPPPGTDCALALGGVCEVGSAAYLGTPLDVEFDSVGSVTLQPGFQYRVVVETLFNQKEDGGTPDAKVNNPRGSVVPTGTSGELSGWVSTPANTTDLTYNTTVGASWGMTPAGANANMDTGDVVEGGWADAPSTPQVVDVGIGGTALSGYWGFRWRANVRLEIRNGDTTPIDCGEAGPIAPAAGQPVGELSTQTGTTRTTNYSYAPGSLKASVAGVLVPVVETDPTNGEYELPFDPGSAVVVTHYQGMGVNGIITGATNTPLPTGSTYGTIPPELLPPTDLTPDKWKEPVRVKTTASVTISTALNPGDTVDGVTLAEGDRVLVASQSTGSQNGIYVVSASPIRATDFDEDDEVLGSIVYVIAGTAGGGTTWRNTNTTVPDVGTDTISFASFGGVSDHGALTGLGEDDHTQYLLRSIVDAKGDVLAATANDVIARVPVGTDGQVLTADSGATPGVSWQDASTDPADDTAVWMPLTTVVAGDPVLVWDGDDSLIPTLIPL